MKDNTGPSMCCGNCRYFAFALGDHVCKNGLPHKRSVPGVSPIALLRWNSREELRMIDEMGVDRYEREVRLRTPPARSEWATLIAAAEAHCEWAETLEKFRVTKLHVCDDFERKK